MANDPTPPPSANAVVNSAPGKNLNSGLFILASLTILSISNPSPLSISEISIPSSSSASCAASNPARPDRPPIPAIFPRFVRPKEPPPFVKPNLPNKPKLPCLPAAPIKASLPKAPGAEFTTAFAEGGGVGSLAMNEEGVDQKFVSDEAGALPKKGGGVTPSDMGKLKKSDFDSEEDYQRYLRQLNKKAEGGTIKDFEKFMKERMEMEKMMNQKRLIEDFKQYMNRGKPVEAKEGGLMDLGGMEMDLRGGGFVPLGAKEKADDVPARLSKNEFVMTADAVRAAGGGSIDKGADKMYNLMKDLEAKV